MNAIRRLATTARRQAAATRAAARRRPRTFLAAGLLVSIAVLAGAGELALISTTPPTSPTVTTPPAFTVRDGWTLADLERHVEAGDIDAVTVTPSSIADPTGQLLARTRTGQVVAIELSVSTNGAVAALNALGYGHLLTTEAIGAATNTTGAASSGGPLAIFLPLLLLAVTVTVVMRMSRRSPAAGRDGASKFSTIMPPD